ncbi:MAG: ribose-phosphate pyrophosphokinase [Myxococcales bacterium]|nr:ribose-phosphate pyrophosphokinase [Myxococcales bacterium]
MLLFAQPGYEAFTEALHAAVGGELGQVARKRFPDGERYQRLDTSVEGRDVVLVGGTVDDAATLALYDLACALVTYGARRLSLVVPYFGYSTMERATREGEVVTAKARARLLSSIPPASAGNRILLLDLHSEGIPHYFEGALTAFHVYGKTVLGPVIRKLGGADFVLGSTDSGRAKWVESLANDLGVDAAFILKRRLSGSETQVTALNARVQGRAVVIYDDMIRTGGSLIGAAQAYRDAGAARLVAVCTHGVLPGDALARLRASGLFEAIVSTDSHPRALALADEGLTIVDVAPAFVAHLQR